MCNHSDKQNDECESVTLVSVWSQDESMCSVALRIYLRSFM